MSNKKIIVVFGATGQSGGSVAKYLLEDGTFAVRAISRNADSKAAQALKEHGAEVVAADLSKPETLDAALAGAYGISAITDFFSLLPTVGFDIPKALDAEVQQGKALIDAAKKAGIQHFFYFTLWHCDAPHFEGKYQVNEYLKTSGLPRTSFYNGSYYENLANPVWNWTRKQDDGTIRLHFPIMEDKYMPCYSVEQSGGWALEAFKHPEKWIGQDMAGIGEHITGLRYAEILREKTGLKFEVVPLSEEEFRAHDAADNAYVVAEHRTFTFFLAQCQPPNSVYDEEASKAQYPEVQDFATFVDKNVGFKKFLASLA